MLFAKQMTSVFAIVFVFAFVSSLRAQHFQAEPQFFGLGDNSNIRSAEPWEVRAYHAKPDGSADRGRPPVWAASSKTPEHKLKEGEVAVFHGAIDITSRGPDGRPVAREFKAGVYGTVLVSKPGRIAVQLANGNIVWYMHASEARIEPSQQVTPDTILGVTGNLGTNGKPVTSQNNDGKVVEMPVHLHVQVSDNQGKLLDPDRAILAGRAEKQDRSIKWKKPDWVGLGPLAIDSVKPVVSPDGVLRSDATNKEVYYSSEQNTSDDLTGPLKTLSAQRESLEKQKSQLDTQLSDLKAQEKQIAAQLKGIDERGLQLNREGKQQEAIEAQLKKERDRLAQREKELFGEAKAVEALSATVQTQAEIDALNARIMRLNSAFKVFGDDKLSFNAKAEEINKKLKNWQEKIDSMQAQQKDTEQRLIKVQEQIGQIAKSQESLKAKLSASEAELAKARNDAQEAAEQRKRLEKELQAFPPASPK